MTAPSTAATLVVGRYTLYGKIASGGMATVYFGRMGGAAGFTRTVAVKRLHPHLAEQQNFVSMMMDEARLAARIQHPNVAQTLDVVATGDELLIVMEYVAGESLARLLHTETARERRLPLPIVSAVMNGVLQGLHAAHEAKSDRGVPLDIVHRDMSPHNVIVGVDGLARVIDFGVAKAAGRLQTTRDGVVKGKVPYMAPEQLSGKQATRLADVYAAGVVLWETLTGTRFIQADDDAGMFAQVMHARRENPSDFFEDIPPALDAVVMRAIDRDPARRFATAREMAEALTRVVPPALAVEVGAWVEEVAKQVLDKRSAQLATIESSSSVTVRPPADSKASAPPDGAAGAPVRESVEPPTEPRPATTESVMPSAASRSPMLSIPAMPSPAQQLVADLRASWRVIVGVGVVALAILVTWLAWPSSSEHAASTSPVAPSPASAGTAAAPTAEPSAEPSAEVPIVPRPPQSAMAPAAPPPTGVETEPPPSTPSAPSAPSPPSTPSTPSAPRPPSHPAAAQANPAPAKPPPRSPSPPPTRPTKPTKPGGGSVVYVTPD